MYEKWKNKYKVSGLYLILMTLSVGIYSYYRFTYSDKYDFIPIIVINIGYFDILALILLVYTIFFVQIKFYIWKKGREKKKNLNENTGKLISKEKAVTCKEEDKLEFCKDAKRFVENIIENINPEDSYSIGIISEWGMGKTSYANLIGNELDKDKYIIIRFNPSLSKENRLIQEDFFEVLYAELKKYSFSFYRLFNRYLASIDIISKYKLYQAWQTFRKFDNREKERKKLNDEIRSLLKRVVIFIDDLDRLDKKGVLEVLKLIYHNASFTNVIFITLYSKKAISSILHEETPTPFSDKYFDMEVLIPARAYGDWYKWLIEKLDTNFAKDTREKSVLFDQKPTHENDLSKSKYPDKKGYNAVLEHDIFLIQEMLPVPRDIKRFTDVFLERYGRVHGEVNFENYFFLHLLYYKYPEIYTNVHQKKYLNNPDENGIYSLKEEQLGKGIELEILKRLFPKAVTEQEGDIDGFLSDTATPYKGIYRTINRPKYFEGYFRESSEKYLTLNELNSLFDYKDPIINIKQWEGEKELRDVVEYISEDGYKNAVNKENLKNFVRVLLYVYSVTSNDNLYQKIMGIIAPGNDFIMAIYPGFPFKDVIQSIFENAESGYLHYKLIQKWIIGLINKETEFGHCIFNVDELQQIAKKNLNFYIEKNQEEFTDINMNLLYTCIADIDQETRIITLDESACKKTRDQIGKYPNYYISNFVRLGMLSSNPEFNSITGEPFYSQIFGGNEAFEKFIQNKFLNGVPRIKRVRSFWKIYKANNYKPIEFENQGAVREKINNDLKDEIKETKNLEKIENEYNKIESELQSGKISPEIINKIDDLIKKLDKIHLNIKKKEDLWRKLHDLKKKYN